MADEIAVTFYIDCSVSEMRERYLKPLQAGLKERGLGRFVHNTHATTRDRKSGAEKFCHMVLFSVDDFKKAMDFIRFELSRLEAPEDTEFQLIER